MEEEFRELCKGGAQNATVCKVRSCSTVEVGKIYYPVGWLLKMVSNTRVIMLEVDYPWFPDLQKLAVYMVRKVVLRTHPMEC